MKRSSLNFPRVVVLVSLVASLAVGVLVWRSQRELAQIETDLRFVPALVKEIQLAGLELDQLQKMESRDRLQGSMANVESYVRSIAANPNVKVGQVNVTPGRRTTARGIEDVTYTIRPADRNARFSRGSIGNFLYMLEAESRRVKVTRVQMDPVKRLKPGELHDPELWNFEIEITTRRTVES